MTHGFQVIGTSNGLTLIELLIVITIIAILIVVAGLAFQGWRGKYNVESQIKEMYVDLMNTRARALQRNRMHFVRLAATSYIIYEDTNPAPDGNGTLETASDAQVVAKTLDAGNPIVWSDSADIQIDFTQRGFSNDTKTICSNTNVDADYDCIEIAASRINLGKLTTAIPDGGMCVAANCIAK